MTSSTAGSALVEEEISQFSNSKLTLSMLLAERLVEPGEGVLSIDYLGQTFKGDLLPSGKIKSQETNMVFNNPSAWAIYCKKIVNPDKKSGCGWSSVKYKGRKMDNVKNAWLKLKAQRELEKSSHNKVQNENGCDSRVVKYCDLGPKICRSDLDRNAAKRRRNDVLVELESFKANEKMQPFNVSFSSSAMLICQLHAHLSSCCIKGYLAGSWDPNAQNLAITHAFPCLIDSEDEEDEELCAQIEFDIYKEIYARHLSLVGSYGSRASNGPDCAIPTLAESEAQLERQVRLLGLNDASYIPCVCLIIRPFSVTTLSDNKAVFWTMPPLENVSHIEYGRPMVMKYKLVEDPCLSQELLSQIEGTIEFVKKKSKWRRDLHKPWSEESNVHLVTRMGQCLQLYFPKDQDDERLWNFIRTRCVNADLHKSLLKSSNCEEEEEEIDDDEENALEEKGLTSVDVISSKHVLATEGANGSPKNKSSAQTPDLNNDEC